MSREIKFRAFVLGKMYEVKELIWGEYFSLVTDGGFITVNDDNVHLMQFTDLKDKNGKEIYEGDVVKWRDEIWVVSWNKRNCQYFLQTIKSFKDIKPIIGEWCFIAERMEKYSEVIGNIYENGDLLK
jgi:uncharacterized phage protein (TIGR01671 family)